MFQKINAFWSAIVDPSTKNTTDAPSVCDKGAYTPTYLLMAKDLNSKESQIFEAAVFKLCITAAVKSVYRGAILKILNDYIKNNPTDANRREYITQCMSEI